MFNHLRLWLRNWLLQGWECPFHSVDTTKSEWVLPLPDAKPSVVTMGHIPPDGPFDIGITATSAGPSTFSYESLRVCPNCGFTKLRGMMPLLHKIRVHCGQCSQPYTVELIEGKEVTRAVL